MRTSTEASMTPATVEKRRSLLDFIEHALVPEPAVQAVIGIGSLATGRARPDSDIDALVLLAPFDPYIVPAEFVWCPDDDSYHSIFSAAAGRPDYLQFDFTRLDLAAWKQPGFELPEGRRAELTQGWPAFTRSDEIPALIARQTVYTDEIRLKKLDEALVWLDQHLGEGRPQSRWNQLGPLCAHARLHAAYSYLVQALFAYNRVWRPWQNREMEGLLTLPWLPDDFDRRALPALNAPSLDHAGYMARAEVLQAMLAQILAHLVADVHYGEDAIGTAFVRSHDEPGRAWNMDAWNTRHAARSADR